LLSNNIYCHSGEKKTQKSKTGEKNKDKKGKKQSSNRAGAGSPKGFL